MSNAFNTNTLARRIVASNEKVTGPPAAEMLRRSGIGADGSNDIKVLDNATGGGILVAELFKHLKQISRSSAVSRVVAGDIDEAMLNYAKQNKHEGVGAEPAWDHVEIKQIDQQSLPLPDNAFSHVFSNFGIFFCKDDEAAMKGNSSRGLTQVTSLIHDWMQKPSGSSSLVGRLASRRGKLSHGGGQWSRCCALFDDLANAPHTSYATPALSAFLPEAPALPAPSGLFPPSGWSDPAAISGKTQAIGFRDAQVSEFSFTPNIEPDEFAEAAGALVKVVAKRVWSQEDNEKFADRIEPSMLKYAMENFPAGRWDGQMTAIITLVKKP